MERILETDVLVIGGGGSGCRAAIESHDNGAKVMMIVKGPFGNSGCTLHVGTSTAIGSWSQAGDSTESSMRDLLTHGGFLGNQSLAKILVDESGDRLIEMQDWGIDFERNDDGTIALHHAAEHSMTRNFKFKSSGRSDHLYGNDPGIAIMDTLIKEMNERSIPVIEEAALVDLLVDSGRVIGAAILDCRSGEIFGVSSKATILATGTYSKVFSPTTVSAQETGDGHAAAFRAGAELIDMESTQFVATSFGYPPGSVFRNALGEEFLHRYGIEEPRKVTKEELCFAIWSEIRAGRGTDRETIFLDLSGPLEDKFTADMLMPNIQEGLHQEGSPYKEVELVDIDPRKTPLHSTPRAHTAIGGVRIDTKCRTTVRGLFACGAAGGGVYGLARPEGYTSMITLVFGRRAGLYAAREVTGSENNYPLGDLFEQVVERFNGSGGIAPEEIKNSVRETTRKHAWVMKNNFGLEQGLKEIQVLAASGVSHSGSDPETLLNVLEARNMLLVSELMFRCSINRRESRGAFFRDDCPETDKKWLRNTICRQVEGQTVLTTMPVDQKYIKPKL